MANENDMEWFTPGKSCKKCDTKPFSGFVFELLHFYESVFPLIRESISEAIKRKLSNRDYKIFQCIFEGKIAIFLFVSGLYLQA
jgi:hypothetical protein